MPPAGLLLDNNSTVRISVILFIHYLIIVYFSTGVYFSSQCKHSAFMPMTDLVWLSVLFFVASLPREYFELVQDGFHTDNFPVSLWALSCLQLTLYIEVISPSLFLFEPTLMPNHRDMRAQTNCGSYCIHSCSGYSAAHISYWCWSSYTYTSSRSSGIRRSWRICRSDKHLHFIARRDEHLNT